MQFIQNILSFNQILTVSLLGWFVAQVLKTAVSYTHLITAIPSRWAQATLWTPRASASWPRQAQTL